MNPINDYRIIREHTGIRHVTRIYWNDSTAVVSFWWRSQPNKPAKKEYFDNLDDARRFADNCDHLAWSADRHDMFSY